MTDERTPMHCPTCGDEIRVGQPRVPTDDGPAHAGCVVDRVTKVHYRDGSMTVDDIALFLAADSDLLPEWMVEAEQHNSLREGPVGVLEQMRDGAVRFRTEGRYEVV